MTVTFLCRAIAKKGDLHRQRTDSERPRHNCAAERRMGHSYHSFSVKYNSSFFFNLFNWFTERFLSIGKLYQLWCR